MSQLYCAPRTGHENGVGELDGLVITCEFWKPEDGSQHRPSGFLLGVTSPSTTASRLLKHHPISSSPSSDMTPQTPQA